MTTFVAEIAFRPAHWNARCGANIPARWTVDLVEGLPQEQRFAHTRIYSEGMQTREEAVQDFIDQLRKYGLTGKLRLINAN